MVLLLFLLLSYTLNAQLTGVSPSSYAFEMVSDTSSGPYGPLYKGVLVTLSGSGSVTWDGGTCFNGYASSVPSKSGTLPMTVRFFYGGYQSGTCTVTFTGGSGGTGTFDMSISKIPNTHATISTDALGNLLSNLAYCTHQTPDNPFGQAYRIHKYCTLQEGSNIRPGGTRTATSQGGFYLDATYGGKVYNQGEFTRSYVVGGQISYNKDYVVLWNGVNAVLHKINAANNSEDMLISGPGAVCNVGSSSNIGLGTTAATAQMGFCLSKNGSVQQDIRKFSWSGTTVTDLGLMHRHPAPMTAGLWGTGQASADGWLSHFHTPTVNVDGQTGTSLQVKDFLLSSTVAVSGDTFKVGNSSQVYTINATITSNSSGVATLTFSPALVSSPGIGTGILMSNAIKGGDICVLNWFESSPTDYCIVAVYPIRNATLGPYPSKSTGLHYIFSASDTPNRTTAYSFDPTTKVLAVSGRDIRVIDNPTSSNTAAVWDNGTCTTDVDCAVAGHHNTVWFAGEPWDCGTGRGKIYQPNETLGGACVRGYGWNETTGRDIVSKGGPVYPPISPLDEYFVGARAPVQVTTGGWGGQGSIPAWRISSCTKSTNVTCTLAAGNLDSSGWVNGTTPIYVDGFSGADASFNGRFTLISKTSNTFVYACTPCTGTTASNVASVTKDVAITTQNPSIDGLGGIRICRLGLGHCRTIAQPMNVSYGDAGQGGTVTGNWQGLNGGSLGYQALNFPTVGQWGERVCWVTDWGYLEKLYTACAETGRTDLGLKPFDLDENTPDSCFDRHGRCLVPTSINTTSITVTYKPTTSTFVCTVSASTRQDFGTTTGTVGSESGTSTRSRTITALTSGTQYWVNAKCGPSGKVWDYAALSVTTK